MIDAFEFRELIFHVQMKQMTVTIFWQETGIYFLFKNHISRRYACIVFIFIPRSVFLLRVITILLSRQKIVFINFRNHKFYLLDIGNAHFNIFLPLAG